ncbi:hypothetical protein RSP822_17085 [Ralstonia solanacearum]|uniref:hypothetical protein n=1 Tax=Ralstonia solanacearum TaxID=305 RepID=UPI000E66F01F|nr:hypothetical protein [Ralstonia solanacearum]RIJ85304.1 hypothetical protein RSP822_17085 [Ralstonia solanacearum]
MTTWQVQLEGDVGDLEFLAQNSLAGPCKVVRDGPQRYLYESDSFQHCSASEEVLQRAVDELAVLSGILKLERNAREGLRPGAVYRPNANGGQDIFVHLRESVQARVEVGSLGVVVTDDTGEVITRPPPASRVASLSKLGSVDAAVAKVLRLLSDRDAMSWVGLYRIYEVIEDDVGGQHKLENRGWGPKEDLKRFKHSANSVQVGGDNSRHGKEPQAPPKNPMTLADAERYVKLMLNAWLAHKGA